MKTRLLKTLLLATLLASVLVATSLPASARIEEVGDELHCLTEDGEDLGQVDADLTEEECLERTPRTRRARLIDRLGEIDQPNVKRKTSRFAIPAGGRASRAHRGE